MDEDELEEIVMWAPEAEEPESNEEGEEEDGPGPPSRLYLSFPLFFL